MYPAPELKRLARYKAGLRYRIGQRRQQCAHAAARVVQPLAWLDHAVAQWRQVSPFVKFAAVPLGLLLKKTAGPRLRTVGKLLRWAPLLFGAFRSLTTTRGR